MNKTYYSLFICHRLQLKVEAFYDDSAEFQIFLASKKIISVLSRRIVLQRELCCKYFINLF